MELKKLIYTVEDGIAVITMNCLKNLNAIDEQMADELMYVVDAAEKDPEGSSAYAEDGVVQQAIRAIKEAYPEFHVITDVCLCEYTSHGHCGLLDGQEVDNDKTLELLAKTALSHAAAGADMVAPSDMMDGRVAAIRAALDGAGLQNIPIMAYSAKYASAFYGPFRAAAGSALMVTVNLMLFRSPKASSQLRKASVSPSTSRPTILQKLSMNMWEMS